MIETLMDEIKATKQTISKLYKAGVLSMDPYESKVHLSSDMFHQNFKDYTVIDRADIVYPLQIEAEVDGIKFYAVLDYKEAIEEYKEAV